VERGDIILIGATTENPSFEVIAALLSRSKVYALRLLTVPEIVTLLGRGLKDLRVEATEDLLEQIAIHANGDGRAAYNSSKRRPRLLPRGSLPRKPSRTRCSAKYCSTTKPARSISI